MKKCPFCSKDIPDEMTFCLYCMNKLTDEKKVENINPKPKKKA